MNTRTLYLLGFLLFSSFKVFAQTQDIDALRTRSPEDSVRMAIIKDKMSKNQITKYLYSKIFRDVYNNTSNGIVEKLAINPYLPFAGMRINTVGVRVLSVAGYSVFDTLKTPVTWDERAINRLHVLSRPKVISKQLLMFKEGDLLDPTIMKENERILRTTRIFHDSRILISPSKIPGEIDVLVLVQDVWSIIPYLRISSLTNFTVGYDDINFRGRGHNLTLRMSYDDNATAGHRFGFSGQVIAPSIFPKTFIRSEIDFQYDHRNQGVGGKVYRNFISTDTKWAGLAEALYTKKLYNLYDTTNQLTNTLTTAILADAYIGRSFPVSKDPNRKGDRIVLSARHRNINYIDSTISTDLFQNINQSLLGLGYTSRKYQRDILIYGFGRTEDVPVGYSASVVWGPDYAQKGKRHYRSLSMSYGNYINHKGFLYGLIEVGGYQKTGKVKDAGVINSQLTYFSRLVRVSQYHNFYIRSFFNLFYTQGLNRYIYEYIDLNGLDIGFKGVNGKYLKGTQRLLFNWESVMFTPLNIYGFRMATYVFSDIGRITGYLSRETEPIYYGFGLGTRFRNENFTFTDLQFQLAYYPNIPGQGKPFIFTMGGIIPLKFSQFSINAPNTLPFK